VLTDRTAALLRNVEAMSARARAGRMIGPAMSSGDLNMEERSGAV
jgi:hypothetical protein